MRTLEKGWKLTKCYEFLSTWKGFHEWFVLIIPGGRACPKKKKGKREKEVVCARTFRCQTWDMIDLGAGERRTVQFISDKGSGNREMMSPVGSLGGRSS